eukprot:5949759-Amphidinium_carterae.1
MAVRLKDLLGWKDMGMKRHCGFQRVSVSFGGAEVCDAKQRLGPRQRQLRRRRCIAQPGAVAWTLTQGGAARDSAGQLRLAASGTVIFDVGGLE